jgi:hypothetical protein
MDSIRRASGRDVKVMNGKANAHIPASTPRRHASFEQMRCVVFFETEVTQRPLFASTHFRSWSERCGSVPVEVMTVLLRQLMLSFPLAPVVGETVG